VLAKDVQSRLLARAHSTPLLAGAKGSRFDLVMVGLYFRRVELPTLTMKDWHNLTDTGLADAIPLNARFTARGLPLVAVPPDYFDLRKLKLAQGHLAARIGEVVIGSSASSKLGISVGDTIFSDQRELYDITKPPALKMRVVGIAAQSGTPDDGAAFVDIKTAWALEGLAHGHADPVKAVPNSLILDKSNGKVAVSEELVDYNEFTDQTISTFHIHGDPDSMPLSAIILVPHSDKDLTVLKARSNAGSKLQVIVPEEAVSEMLAYVAKLRQLLDALSLVLGGMTLVMIALVTALSVRVRSREIETLSRIGAARSTIFALFAWEIVILIALGAIGAVLASALLSAVPPDLVKLL
jgi:putative ABC transport system permease protein